MLINSPRFQKEYKEFSEEISKISDETVKSQLNQLLIKLLGEVRFIDQQHEELNKGAKLASDMIADHRATLQSYRSQIVKRLQECKSSGLIQL
jgi:predicted nuclease with TOPRIM domain